jgi:hypothetical protein
VTEAGEGPGPEEPAPVAPSTRHPWRVAIVVLVAVAAAVVIGGALWVHAESGASGKPGPRVIVTVAEGSGSGQLADTLEAKGVISSALAYRIWSVIHARPELLPGTYAFDKNLSFAAADQVIAGGPNVFALANPPGFTVREVAERVGQLPGHDQSAFDALATGGTVRSPWQPAGSDNLDGLLGTGTYMVVPGETDRQLLTIMIDRFDKEADAVGLASRSAALGLTPYQAVTVASIVEKEGVIAKNLALRRRWGRGDGDPDRPQAADAVQHLPQHRPHSHPHLLPVDGCPRSGPQPPERVVAVLRGGRRGRNRSVLRHLQPTIGQRGSGQATGPAVTGSHWAE